MTKIVVNKCYGGFHLSAEATKMIAKLQGKECYFFKMKSGLNYERVPIEEANHLFVTAFCTPEAPKQDNENWSTMTQEQKDASNKAYEDCCIEDFSHDRTNPLLVQVVEKLGDKASLPTVSNLKVIEIPDDVEWVIEDYDGIETVHEAHRSW